MKNDLNILLLTLENERNLGDTVIADCSKYILKNIFARNNIKCNLISMDFKRECKIEIYNSDIIIFSGGGLISDKYQRLIKRINEITELADKVGKTVIFNAVGVEGYGTSIEYQKLKDILNRDCVKVVSTRDDIDLLRKKYILDNSSTKTERVADPALMTKEVYNISKNKLSDIVGLGIIRSKIFQDNNIEFSESEQLKFWSNIIYELENRGKDWAIFTNGLHRDYNFGVRILEYMGRYDMINGKIIPRPTKPEELIKTIASFQGIIAARLHANIIAYALGIPSIGVVWNPKLTWFGDIIGKPNRFFKVNNLNTNKMVQKLQQSIQEGYDNDFFQKYQRTASASLEDYIKEYVEKN